MSNNSYSIQLRLQSSPEKKLHIFRKSTGYFLSVYFNQSHSRENALPYWSPAPIPNKGSKVSKLLVI